MSGAGLASALRAQESAPRLRPVDPKGDFAGLFSAADFLTHFEAERGKAL